MPIQKIEERIWSISIFSIIPLKFFEKNKMLGAILGRFVSMQITHHLKKINSGSDDYRKTIIWTDIVSRVPLYCNRRRSLLVYDCRDEWIVTEDNVQVDQEVIENELLKQCDLCFAVSKYTYEKKKFKTKTAFYIPQGISERFLAMPRLLPSLLRDTFAKLTKPVVGYVGNIRTWLDFELLEEFARTFSGASFVFVGNVEPDVKSERIRLDAYPNVCFLGRQDHGVIPDIIREFDVGLVPFKKNEFNLSTAPYKFMEYMALGKPILSLNIVELRQYADIVDLYETHEEAIKKLRNLLMAVQREELVRKRIELAGDHTIDKLSKRYHAELSRAIAAL